MASGTTKSLLDDTASTFDEVESDLIEQKET